MSAILVWRSSNLLLGIVLNKGAGPARTPTSVASARRPGVDSPAGPRGADAALDRSAGPGNPGTPCRPQTRAMSLAKRIIRLPAVQGALGRVAAAYLGLVRRT